MNWTPTTTRTIDLGYEQLLTFEGRPGTRVRVLYGSMWLTEEGNTRDVFARCGEEITLGSDGLSVIEGIGAARVQVIEPSRPAPLAAAGKHLAHVWEAMRARRPWREVLARTVLMGLAIAVSAVVLHVAAPGALVSQASGNAPAQATAATGAVHTVLDAIASAGTGFLAVN